MQFSNSPVALVSLACAIIVFTFFGSEAKQKNDKWEAEYLSKLEALKVAPEPVETLLGSALVHKETSTIHTRHSTSVNRYWTFFETDDWVFLNGSTGASTCRSALGGFAEANAPQTGIGPDQLEIVISAFKGKKAAIWAHVPRFKSEPRGLESCLGYGYDEKRGLLTIGNKPVALLAALQPGLRSPSSTSAK